MLTKLTGGMIYDPVQRLDGVIGDVFLRDGLIVPDPGPGAGGDAVYGLSGQIVMAGGVDIHSHIAGGNVDTARMLLPEQFARAFGEGEMLPVDRCSFTAREIGTLYARMGYTTVVEPAVLPCGARTAHLEMSDIPVIDKAALAILGNDDFLLRLLRSGASQSAITDYAAWILGATRALGIKCINAGGVAGEPLLRRVEIGRRHEPGRGDAEGKLEQVVVAHVVPEAGWIPAPSVPPRRPALKDKPSRAAEVAVLDRRPSRRPMLCQHHQAASRPLSHPLATARRPPFPARDIWFPATVSTVLEGANGSSIGECTRGVLDAIGGPPPLPSNTAPTAVRAPLPPLPSLRRQAGPVPRTAARTARPPLSSARASD